MELRFLPFRRCGKGYHAKDAGTHALHDALDHAAFAGSISAFEYNHDPRVSRFDPVLKLDQLHLQLEEFGLVFFIADLRFAIDAGAPSGAFRS
jgi:hypothetical protein